MSNRLILGLGNDVEQACALINAGRSVAGYFLINRALWAAWGRESLTEGKMFGVRLIMDLRFDGPPSEVIGSLEGLSRHAGADCVWGVTLSGWGGFAPLHDAVQGLDRLGSPASEWKLFASLVPPHFRERDLFRTGVNRSIPSQARKLAQLSADAGMSGVLVSGPEVKDVRKAVRDELFIVAQSVRLEMAPRGQLDERRPVSPGKALADGADFLVVSMAALGAKTDWGRSLEALDNICKLSAVSHQRSASHTAGTAN